MIDLLGSLSADSFFVAGGEGGGGGEWVRYSKLMDSE